MLPYSDKSALNNQIQDLSDASPETAKEYLKSFAIDYRLHECRTFLWIMVETCLTTENSEFSEPDARADLLLRFNHLQKLFEAAFIIADQWGTR
jgi:hypothetical protein